MAHLAQEVVEGDAAHGCPPRERGATGRRGGLPPSGNTGGKSQTGDGRRFAYADPPYLGCAKRYYGKRHDQAAVYDTVEGHRALIDRLESEFPDGWALSCHVPSLGVLLSMCRPGVRVGAWVKPFSGVRPRVRARFGWEPVIYRTSLAWDFGPQFTDYVIANGNRKVGERELFEGQKPEVFAAWIADLLGYRVGDSIVDLFPGSGALSRAFAKLDARCDAGLFQLDLVA